MGKFVTKKKHVTINQMYRKGDHDKVIQNSILRLMVGFSKYEFYNKLLVSVTLLRVKPSVTLNNVTSLNIF